MSRTEAAKIRRRLNAARKGLFPEKTCPASRHVHIIVEGLLDPKCQMHRDLLGYEPEHMASSIASVLEGLWQARRWMKYEALPPTARQGYRGRWVPDFAALDAQRIEARSDETPQEARPVGQEPDGEADAP